MTDVQGEHGVRPHHRARRRFGQHFLERAWADKLIAALAAAPDDRFLEIGPGRGALTRLLAPLVREVVAVEIDRDLAAALSPVLPANVRVVQADFLDVDVAALLADGSQPVRVVGNLPYNVSSPILFKLIAAAEEGRLLSDATLMLQKEVVDRMVATPGGGNYGTLAVQIGLVADVERLLTLPPGAFRPPPQVTSGVVRLRFHPAVADAGSPETFRRLVRGVFLQRRKTLANALQPVATSMGTTAQTVLARAGLDGRRRPETVSVQEMALLSRLLDAR